MSRRYVARVHYRRRPFKILGIPTSPIEIRDIIKAWLVISVIFAIIRLRYSLGSNALFLVLADPAVNAVPFFREVLIAGITVGIGFLLHELSHKVVAQRYGNIAEFRSDDSLLVIALVMAVFLGFVFVAPGATVIAGQVSREQSGIIAIAGPWSNIVIASFFAIAALLVPISIVAEAAGIGYTINVWLGLFNMIPFFILDGKKVWDWNKLAWLGTVAVCVLMLFSPFPARTF